MSEIGHGFRLVTVPRQAPNQLRNHRTFLRLEGNKNLSKSTVDRRYPINTLQIVRDLIRDRVSSFNFAPVYTERN